MSQWELRSSHLWWKHDFRAVLAHRLAHATVHTLASRHRSRAGRWSSWLTWRWSLYLDNASTEIKQIFSLSFVTHIVDDDIANRHENSHTNVIQFQQSLHNKPLKYSCTRLKPIKRYRPDPVIDDIIIESRQLVAIWEIHTNTQTKL